MPHSLWILPEDTQRYQKIIDELAEKYNSPRFRPHITLVGDIKDKDIFEKAKRLASEMKPFKIKITKPSYMHDYYRCVLALAEKNKIMDYAKLAREIFSDYNKREYIPHLSLLYGNMDEETKKRIVSELPNFNDRFTAMQICIVTSGVPPGQWEVVKIMDMNNKL